MPEFGLREFFHLLFLLFSFANFSSSGQVIGLINDIPSCEELLRRIEKEAEESLAQSQALIVPRSKL